MLCCSWAQKLYSSLLPLPSSISYRPTSSKPYFGHSNSSLTRNYCSTTSPCRSLSRTSLLIIVAERIFLRLARMTTARQLVALRQANKQSKAVSQNCFDFATLAWNLTFNSKQQVNEWTNEWVTVENKKEARIFSLSTACMLLNK